MKKIVVFLCTSILLPMTMVVYAMNTESSYSGVMRTDRMGSYEDVQAFISDVAKRNKLDKNKIQKVFDKIMFDYSVIDRMDTPTEKRSWAYYNNALLSAKRISGGAEYMRLHRKALNDATDEYKLPQHVITAVIGIETTYGKVTLKHKALQSIATLAFVYPRRATYFKGELEKLLILADKHGVDPLYYESSYAGAVGIPQFMPSSMLLYAIDGDNDGRVDIVNSHDDAIASVANYMGSHGWTPGKNIATIVHLTKSIPEYMYSVAPCSASERHSTREFRSFGIYVPAQYADSERGILAKLYEDEEEGTFTPVLLFENACSIYKYNKSFKYVTAISLLADAVLEEFHK